MSTRFSVRVSEDLFSEGNFWRYYYRDGRLYGESGCYGLRLFPAPVSKVELTRAQGYRYWAKHFPDRACYTLPEALQEAIDRPPVSSGYYVDHSGELVGYEG